MTTSRRIVITQDSVRLALADLHARFSEMPLEFREQRNAEVAKASPGEYAASTAAYVFSLLEKHSEPTP